MIKNSNRKLDIVCFTILQLFVLVSCMMICVVHSLSFIVGIKYFLFELLGVFSPGLMAITLLKIDCKNSIYNYALSYAFGFIVLFIEYFIVMLFDVTQYSFALSLIVGVISIIVYIKKCQTIQYTSDKTSWRIVLFFIFVVLFLDFWVVSVCNTMPTEINETWYYVDFLYWIGNNISFMKGFPAQSLFCFGHEIRYHCFSSIFMAQTGLITGIDAKVIGFYFSYLIPEVLLVLSGFSLFSKLIKNNYLRFVAVLALMLTDGSTISYAWHLHMCPFGFDYGLAFSMVAFCLLIDIVEKKDFSLKYGLISALMIGMSTGSKGPVAMVVLMGFAVVAFNYLIKKEWKKGFVYGILWLGAFLSVYFLFISGPGTGTIAFKGIVGAFNENPWAETIVSSLYFKNIFPTKIIKAYALLLYVYRANKTAVFLLGIATVCFINSLKKKSPNLILLACSLIGIWGIFLTINLVQDGGSQMYFIMSTIPYCILGGLYSIDLLLGKKKYVVTNIVLAIVVTTTWLGCSTFFKLYVGPCLETSVNIIVNDCNSQRTPFYVDKEIIEATEWMKNNTEVDTVFAIDNFENGDEYWYNLILASFSERYIWNDGYYSKSDEIVERKQIAANFTTGNENSYENLVDSGVSYYIHNKNGIYSMESVDKNIIELVFSNSLFDIYRIK